MVDQSRELAVLAAQAQRAHRPKPTSLTDIDAVLGWLERRQARMREAAGAAAEGGEGSPDPSSGLQHWRPRTLDVSPGSPDFRSPETPGLGPESPFDRQRRLVMEAEEANGGPWSSRSRGDSDESDESGDEDDDDEDDDDERAERRRMERRRRGGGAGRAKLAQLEQSKSDAKRQVVEAERGLRKRLGRKPTEAERHGDAPFQDALKAFKQASQILFVAMSIANWDD